MGDGFEPYSKRKSEEGRRKLLLTCRSDRDYPTESADFCYGIGAINPVAAKTLSLQEPSRGQKPSFFEFYFQERQFCREIEKRGFLVFRNRVCGNSSFKSDNFAQKPGFFEFYFLLG